MENDKLIFDLRNEKVQKLLVNLLNGLHLECEFDDTPFGKIMDDFLSFLTSANYTLIANLIDGHIGDRIDEDTLREYTFSNAQSRRETIV